MTLMTTVGSPTAENSGQKIGRLIKMCDFRLHFSLFWTALHRLIQDFHYSISKYYLFG